VGASENHNQELEILVRKAIAGDEIAFGQIYDLYFEKVYRFIYFRVSHRESAQDLVADVFVKVWDKLGKIQDVRSFNGWIYQIARNLVIDHYRSRKQDIDISLLENVLEYEDNMVDRANLTFQQKAFISELKNLTPEQQMVIKMKFLEDLDNSEIAKILDKSEGAIRVIQHRAIAELKHLLDKDNERE
jgi:RNA polymerase sigma-70 factor (ECF subfamily)